MADNNKSNAKSNQDEEISVEEQNKNRDKFGSQVESLVEQAEEHLKNEDFNSAIENYTDALNIVKEHPWGIKEFQINDMLQNVYEKKTIHFRKVLKEKEIEKITKEKEEKARKLAEAQERLKNRELTEKEEKIRLLQEKKKREEDLSNNAYDLLEQGTRLAKNEEFDEAISRYKDAISLFKEINWIAEAKRVEEDALKDVIDKKNKKLKLLEEKKRKEAEVSSKIEETITGSSVKKEKIEFSVPKVDKKEDKKIDKKNEEEISNKAFDLLEKGTKLVKNEEFDLAIKKYEEAISLFKEINWTAEAKRVEEDALSDVIQRKQRKLKEIESRKKKEEDAKLKHEEQLRSTAKSDKKDDEIQKSISITDDKKKQKDKINQAQEIAFDALDEANKFVREKELEKAIEKFKIAMEIFESIEWTAEAEKVHQEIIKNKKIIEKSTQEKIKKEKDDLENKVYSLMEEGSKAIKNKEYDLGIEKYKESLELCEKLGWTAESKRLQETIKDTEKEKEKYFAKSEKAQKEQEKLRLEKEMEMQRLAKIREEEQKKAEEISKKTEEQKELAKLKAKIEAEAFELLDEANILIEADEFKGAIERLEKAKNNFVQIGWHLEADKVDITIKKTQKSWEKHEKEEKLRELKAEQQRKEKEELQKQIEEQKKAKTKKEQEIAEQKAREIERKKIEKETSESAFNMIENIEEKVTLYKGLVNRKDFDSMECPYQEAKEVYSEAKNMLVSIGWTNEANKLDESILNYEKLFEKDMKLREFEEKKKLMSQKEQEEFQKQLEEQAKLKEQEEAQKAEKLKLESEKKSKEKEVSTKAFEMIDELELNASNYKNSVKNKDFSEKCPYNEIKESYIKIKDMFISIGWKTEATRIDNSISLYEKLFEQDKKLRDIEEKRKEKEEQENAALKKQMEEYQELMKNKEKQKAEKADEEANRQRLEKEISQKAFGLIDAIEAKIALYKDAIKQKDYSMECPYLEAKNVYTEAIDLFYQIGWKTEANRISELTTRYNELYKQDQKIRELEEQKRIKKQKEEEEIQKQLEEHRKILEAKEKEKLNKLSAEQEKSKIEKEISEKAFSIIDKIEEQVSVYKGKIHQKDFTMDCPYLEAKNIYTEARKMLREIGWKEEADRLNDSITLYEQLYSQDQRLRELEEKKREKQALEEAEMKRRLEEHKKMAEKKSSEIAEKEEIARNKQRLEKEISTKVFSMIDDIEEKNKRYKSLVSAKDFSMDCPYLEAIEVYSQAQKMLLDIGWKNEASKLTDSISNLRKLEENDRKTRIIEENLKIKKQKEEEEIKKQLEVQKAAMEEKMKKLMDKKADEEERKKIEDSISKKAFEMIDNIENTVKIYKERVKQQDFSLKCPYLNAKEVYQEAQRMFTNIGWNNEADKLTDPIRTYEDLFKKDTNLRISLEKKHELIEKDQKELQERIAKAKLEEEKLALKNREEILQKRKKELENAELQDKAFKLLDEGNDALNKNDFDLAERAYSQAKAAFEKADWYQGVEMVNDALVNLKRTKEREEIRKAQMIKTTEEAEKSRQELEEKLKKAKSEEEKKKLETQKKALEHKLKADKEEKINNEIMKLLEEGSILVESRNFNDGISKFEQTLPLFDEISWELKRKQVIDMIETAKRRQKQYQKKLEYEKEEQLKKQAEQQRMQQQIEEHQKMLQAQKEASLEEKKKQAEQSQQLKELEETANSEIDRGNASLQRRKYERALESFQIAFECFEKLGWNREANAMQEKINSTRQIIIEQQKPQKEPDKSEDEKSAKAYAKVDEADKSIRSKKYERALIDLNKALAIFKEIGWTKAITMVEGKIESTIELNSQHKETLEKMRSRRTQKNEEEAFRLLDQVTLDRSKHKYEEALENAKKAQDIFRSVKWEKEAEDMNKLITEIENEIQKQKETSRQAERLRRRRQEEEETEEERLQKIIEERRRKRRQARKNLLD